MHVLEEFMKKLYKFYVENVYKKSRETKDLTDGLYYVLKKIVEDNFEEKKIYQSNIFRI